jgi:hypothetical protein
MGMSWKKRISQSDMKLLMVANSTMDECRDLIWSCHCTSSVGAMIPTEHADRARVVPAQAEDQVEGSRLARPIRSNQAVNGPAGHRQVKWAKLKAAQCALGFILRFWEVAGSVCALV